MRFSSAPERFLIVKLSAIGDVVHGLPVLNALRAGFPKAFIAWAVEGAAATLLRGHRALDELIALPRGWLKGPAAVWDLRRRLRELRLDVALDLQGLARSAIVSLLSGARVRIGFDGADGREMSRYLNNLLVLPSAHHVVDRNLQLLGPLGVTRPARRFDLPETEADYQLLEPFLRGAGLLGRFAVLNPGAGWPSKRWEMDRFGAVARFLGERGGLRSVVVWAGAEEKAWAEQIVAASAGQAILAPPTSLRQLAALLRRARLFVGADTGPLHIAAAVGASCVGLFGPMPAERNGPWGTGHIALQRVCLQGSSRQRRQASNEAMRAISIADVTAACERLLRQAA